MCGGRVASTWQKLQGENTHDKAAHVDNDVVDLDPDCTVFYANVGVVCLFYSEWGCASVLQEIHLW